ncbi:hypothetical protein AAFN60_06530 [Roseibacillus persicicus]|uniref:hypothetical protein n=1 Tax=Roseibacillus persicicus TaxID=454148 RepID=UPI00398ABC81
MSPDWRATLHLTGETSAIEFEMLPDGSGGFVIEMTPAQTSTSRTSLTIPLRW